MSTRNVPVMLTDTKVDCYFAPGPGDQPTFPFVYSNEVWTGIEYQVASHLMLMGEEDKGPQYCERSAQTI